MRFILAEESDSIPGIDKRNKEHATQLQPGIPVYRYRVCPFHRPPNYFPITVRTFTFACQRHGPHISETESVKDSKRGKKQIPPDTKHSQKSGSGSPAARSILLLCRSCDRSHVHRTSPLFFHVFHAKRSSEQ